MTSRTTAPRAASRRVKTAVAAAFTFAVAALGIIVPQQPAEAALVKYAIGNAYQYVSDQGTATFWIPWRDNGTTAYADGQVWAYTASGTAGTLVTWSATLPHSDGYDNITPPATTLPAFAADGSTTPIGTWSIPGSAQLVRGPDQAPIVLQLDAAHIDWAGPIRPLKVALGGGSPALKPWVSQLGTFVPLTLAKSHDVSDVLAATGTLTPNIDRGSCINSTTGLDERRNDYCAGEGTLSLVDSHGNPVQTLPMRDNTGATIGTWSIDAGAIAWTLSTAVADVTEVAPVTYTYVDARGPGWSGWFEQGVTLPANIVAGPASYGLATATLTVPTPSPSPTDTETPTGTPTPTDSGTSTGTPTETDTPIASITAPNGGTGSELAVTGGVMVGFIPIVAIATIAWGVILVARHRTRRAH